MTESEAEILYRAIARDPRYGHYVRIPARVCKCLDYFGAAYDRPAVLERLHAYYLFIGIADDAIDSRGVETGREILRHFGESDSRRGDEEARTPVRLSTDMLKRHIAPEMRARVVSLLGELYAAVVREQRAASLSDLIEERKRVGRLTAEISYVLVAPLIDEKGVGLRCFLASVGEVGCLVDSLVDLGADASAGALGFEPTARDRLRLAARTLSAGARLLFGRPRLALLFLEGVSDVLRDRRVRAAPPTAAGARLGKVDSLAG